MFFESVPYDYFVRGTLFGVIGTILVVVFVIPIVRKKFAKKSASRRLAIFRTALAKANKKHTLYLKAVDEENAKGNDNAN